MRHEYTWKIRPSWIELLFPFSSRNTTEISPLCEQGICWMCLCPVHCLLCLFQKLAMEMKLEDKQQAEKERHKAEIQAREGLMKAQAAEKHPVVKICTHS